MSDWTERPESIVLDVEPPPEAKRKASVVGTSFAIHAILLVLLVLSQASLKHKPDKDEPVLPLLFEQPVQPRPREQVTIVPPRSRPLPLPPRPQEPAPQNPTQPVQPAPPAPPPDTPLIGWGTKGAQKGHNDKPPGPEAKTLGPDAPGPKGKGMKDAADAPEAPPIPPSSPDTPGGEEKRAGADPQNPLDHDPSLMPPPERLPPASDSGPRGGAGQRPVYRNPGSARTGRVGQRGSGFDPNVGMNGGFFGDIQFDDGNEYNWQEYSTKIYFLIRNAWIREMHARTTRFERDQNRFGLANLDGTAVIHFVIHRDGSIDNVQVVGPSPVPTLDESASFALQRVALLPLPSDFPRNQEGVTFGFRLSGFLSSHQLRAQLDYEVTRLQD